MTDGEAVVYSTFVSGNGSAVRAVQAFFCLLWFCFISLSLFFITEQMQCFGSLPKYKIVRADESILYVLIQLLCIPFYVSTL